MIAFCLGANAQNTKGDKPAPPPTTPPKEKKGLFGKKQGKRLQSTGKRSRNVFPQSGPFVHNPSKKPKKEKASHVRLPTNRVSKAPSGRDRAWTQGDASGKRIKISPQSGRIKNVYPQRGPYVHNPSPRPKKEKPSSVRLPSAAKTVKRPRGKDKAWTKGDIAGHRIPSTQSQRKPNIIPQRGPFVSYGPRPKGKPRNEPLNPSRRLSVSKAVAQGRSMGIRGAGFKSITSRFVTRGKKNVYWGKFRKKEKAITTDIAGRKLRTRNYHSPRPGLVGRDTLHFFRRSPKSVRRATSAPGGGYKSATRAGRPWSGDISGNKIRRNKAPGNKEVAGEFVWPRKMSVTGKIKRSGYGARAPIQATPKKRKIYTSPIPAKAPGIGGAAFQSFSRLAKPQKRIHGAGGSLSGKLWSNRNQPIQGKAPGIGAGAFLLFSKQSRPLKRLKGYGGSTSGRIWNNNNKPIMGKGLSLSSYFAADFSGRTKTRRPPKGGGSISGKLWNNNNQPVDVNTAGRGTVRASKFQGHAKVKRPPKGGGSVSGKIWNNNNQPVDVNTAGRGTVRASKFQGHAKVKRPPKGGGSVSGKIWNNNNQPVDVNTAGRGTVRASKFQGHAKMKRPPKGGGSVSGKIWNNNNQPIVVNGAGKGTVRAAKYRGTIKYRKPEETAGESATFRGKIKGMVIGPEITQLGLNYDGDNKRKKQGIDNKQVSLLTKIFKKDKSGILPGTHIKRDERVTNYAMKGKRSIFSRYVQNPNANKLSLKKDRQPDGLRLNIPIANQMRRSVNAGHYNHVMRQHWDYTRNPNSNREALKVREPGKANARIGDLQVNVKMRKTYNGELHPDAKFAHGFRDNVKEERTLLMNIRLTWAKLFKKGENQPRGLKQKSTRPRYDPNEKGLWYD